MARVPGVPALEPVSQPLVNPAEAGRPGESISQLGDVSNDATLQQQGLNLFIKKAQQNVDAIAAQNDYTAAEAKYQEALSKTTNSRDVADVTKQAQDNLNDIAKKWQNSPALAEIQQAGDALRPRLDHLGQVKSIDLMGKEWGVQTEIQMQTLIPQMVTAQRNGDKAQADYINGYIDKIFEDGKKSGLITDADKQLGLNKIDIQVRQQGNEAAISSADPKERQAAIQQLKTGGSGPLNLSGVAAGDIAALRTQAEAKNRELNNLNEAQNLNRSLNVIDNVFSAPEYKNNYEARLKSLQDGEWLKQNGIVAEDGSPDRVMADKLIAETTRQRAEAEKVQTDNDNKALDKYAPMIDDHKLTRGQIDQIPGLSPRARSVLEHQWNAEQARGREEWRLNHTMAIGERQEREREIADHSTQLYGQLSLEIAAGKVYEPMDIREMDGLLPKDKAQILGDLKEQNPYVKDGLNKISELGILDSRKYELARVFVNQVKSGDARGSSIVDVADKLIKQSKAQHSQEWIDQLYRQMTEGRRPDAGIDQYLKPMGSGSIVQHSPSTEKDRYSTDGGKTWLPGKPPTQ